MHAEPRRERDELVKVGPYPLACGQLETQERVIAGYAMQLGLRVERVFVERGVSGSKPLAFDAGEGFVVACDPRPAGG
jgi:hypothetical protein